MRFVASLVALAAPAFAGAAHGASFDCTTARAPVEQLICADPELGALDERLATAYRALLKKLGPPAQKATRRSQARWLKDRTWLCELNDTPDAKEQGRCLSQVYTERIETLEEYQLPILGHQRYPVAFADPDFIGFQLEGSSPGVLLLNRVVAKEAARFAADRSPEEGRGTPSRRATLAAYADVCWGAVVRLGFSYESTTGAHPTEESWVRYVDVEAAKALKWDAFVASPQVKALAKLLSTKLKRRAAAYAPADGDADVNEACLAEASLDPDTILDDLRGGAADFRKATIDIPLAVPGHCRAANRVDIDLIDEILPFLTPAYRAWVRPRG